MVPSHPKFRNLLLKDRELKSLGITNKIIQSWDQNVTRLYYLKKYSRKFSETMQDDLKEEIDALIGKFKPKLRTIHQKWVTEQKKNMKVSYFSMSPDKLLINSFIIFWLWLVKLYHSGKDSITRKRTDASNNKNSNIR
ncbi:MAG: hypothetical protein MUC94_07105 [bacterium]|nr:hypothetical protein [bacterium]